MTNSYRVESEVDWGSVRQPHIRGSREWRIRMTQDRPIPDSYWVEPRRLLAGEYPGAKEEVAARAKVRKLLDAGITLFLDLTHEYDHLEPYRELLGEVASAEGHTVEHQAMPIRDYDVPTAKEMVRILDVIDGALEAGKVVYVHCWGGIGRTGTVVGCYMVRHGRTYHEALDEIKRLRGGTPDCHRPSPQSDAQHDMVRRWQSLDTAATGR